MRIFLIGQCTLHWGRMEFGNIGNFYIIKPMFEQLRRVFPKAEIATTMQFSKNFCNTYSIETVSMELYYDFNSNSNLKNAINEYDLVKRQAKPETEYIKEVSKADVVIDFSGDIWGDNADFLGKDRFATGCYKDLTAQALKPTVMIAGSPGPFTNNIELAKQTYKGFKFISNREPISSHMLQELGFDIRNTYTYACPSFLFTKSDDSQIENVLKKHPFNNTKLNIGFILCGWNFKRAPFSAWPRDDYEYSNFVKLITTIINEYDAHIYLLSHSNGFDIPPATFKLKHGRDFPIVEQLHNILKNSDVKNRISLLDGIYTPEQTKAIISHFDILISGRMHGAVAGLSQCIPTVIIDYGHEPKAHKLKGFAEMVGMPNIICDPNDADALISNTKSIIDNKNEIHNILVARMQTIKNNAIKQFDCIAELISQ